MRHAELSDDLYLRFRDLLRTRCGLEYPERKRADLAHGLNLALNATQQPSLAALYADVVAGGSAWEAIITQLTIGETYFFRNDAHFAALREHIVPDLLHRRASTRTLRLWSAGCATGEEPYSLAILLREFLLNDPAWNINILATDINPVFLARAREARYGSWSFRETPDALRDRFWITEQGRWCLHPAIRRMVTFAALNLAEPCYPMITNGTSALDLIVCRNVTIYFDTDTTRQVAERFYRALTPGGWLIVGHAEPQASVYHQFEVHNFPNTVVYRKPLDAPPFAGVSVSTGSNAGTRPILIPSASVETMLDNQIRGDFASGSVARPKLPAEQAPEPGTTSRLIQAPSTARHLATDGWPAIATQLAQGDTIGVESLVHEVLRADPSHMPARLALGTVYADRADWARARQQCMLVLERNPLCISAQYLLGQIHEHQEQRDSALAAYRRTVYLDPHFVLGMLGMARMWHQLGRHAEAQRAARNAVWHLATLPPAAPVPGMAGVTAGELRELAQQQLAALTGSG